MFEPFFNPRKKFLLDNVMLTQEEASRLVAVEGAIVENFRNSGDARSIRTQWLNFLKRYVCKFFNEQCPKSTTGLPISSPVSP